MNKYLKENSPKISLTLIIILLMFTIITLSYPGFSKYFLLNPSNLNEPLNWYRFLTYPLYVNGLMVWAHNALVILLTGFIVENKLERKEIIGLIILSSVIGGVFFTFINQSLELNVEIATPTMITWGYWSSAVVFGIGFWKRLNLFEKIITVLCVLSLIGIWDDNEGFLIGQIMVIITIMILTIRKTIKIKKTGYNTVQIAKQGEM